MNQYQRLLRDFFSDRGHFVEGQVYPDGDFGNLSYEVRVDGKSHVVSTEQVIEQTLTLSEDDASQIWETIGALDRAAHPPEAFHGYFKNLAQMFVEWEVDGVGRCASKA